MKASQRGSAIIMLFIAVALFGLVSYAFLHGSRGNMNMITDEASKASGYQSQDCSNAVNMATKRLEARGCGTQISYLADGSNINTGAPRDGSCSVFHPNGGGVKPCNTSAIDPGSTCILTLNVGESCNGLVYAGELGGERLYTTPADTTQTTYNNGTLNWGGTLTGAQSTTNGMANTDWLVAQTGAAAPFRAAQACRALGAEWYLPSRDELLVLYNARNTGDFSGTFKSASTDAYWSSTSSGGQDAYRARFFNGTTPINSRGGSYYIRCVRKDD